MFSEYYGCKWSVSYAFYQPHLSKIVIVHAELDYLTVLLLDPVGITLGHLPS